MRLGCLTIFVPFCTLIQSTNDACSMFFLVFLVFLHIYIGWQTFCGTWRCNFLFGIATQRWCRGSRSLWIFGAAWFNVHRVRWGDCGARWKFNFNRMATQNRSNDLRLRRRKMDSIHGRPFDEHSKNVYICAQTHHHGNGSGLLRAFMWFAEACFHLGNWPNPNGTLRLDSIRH